MAEKESSHPHVAAPVQAPAAPVVPPAEAGLRHGMEIPPGGVVVPSPVVPVAPLERWSRAAVAKHHAAISKLMTADMSAITAAISTADAVMVNPASTDGEVNAAAEAIVKACDDMHALMETTKAQLVAVTAAMPPRMAPPFVIKDK